MDPYYKRLFLIFGGLVLLLLLVWGPLFPLVDELSDAIEDFRRPRLERAYVVSLVGDSEVASDRPKVTRVGSKVTLYAVVEARFWYSSRSIYLTTAPALELAGERIPDSRLRHWKSGWGHAVVMWFNVEPSYGLGIMADPAGRFGAELGHGGGGPGWSQRASYWPNSKGRRLALAVLCNNDDDHAWPVTHVLAEVISQNPI